MNQEFLKCVIISWIIFLNYTRAFHNQRYDCELLSQKLYVYFQGCASPIVVKFADTQKDKDQKRQQTIQSTHMGNLSATAIAPMSQPQPFLSVIIILYTLFLCLVE